MNIPKEAVEAGAKAYRAKVEWIDRHSRDDYGREDELGMRAALEAAAPYMLGEAWKEGEAAGQDNAYAYQIGIAVKSNPYRTIQ